MINPLGPFATDFIVVGSDSGRIVILEYIPFKNVFERVSTGLQFVEN